MEKLDIPIVCNLDAIEAGERSVHSSAWGELAESCLGSSEEPGAVAFRYPARADLLSAAAEWIGRERHCCAFFDFDLSLPAGAEEFVVRIGGGPGVKEFVLANMVPQDAGR